MSTRRKWLYILAAIMGLVMINWLGRRYGSLLSRLGDTSGRTDLHWAASDGRAWAVKKLLAKGADVNCRSKSGYTPLDDAAGYGHKKTVEVLIANGADLNARSKPHGSTPLHTAASAGWVEVVKVLLAAGANANAKNKHGFTPLDLAVNSHQNIPSIIPRRGMNVEACIEALRNHGAGSASASSPPPSVAPSVTKISRGGVTITMAIFLIGGAVSVVGHFWIVVLGFRKDVLWGFGCMFSPVNLVFALENWDECKLPFWTCLAGGCICLVGFFVGPTIDILIMSS